MIEKNPVSINYLLNNFAPTSPIAVWTSSYLNLVPPRYIIITWNSLSGYDYSAPNSYWSWIIKKALVTEQLTGIIDDKSAPHSEDFRNVGGRNLRRLDLKKQMRREPWWIYMIYRFNLHYFSHSQILKSKQPTIINNLMNKHTNILYFPKKYIIEFCGNIYWIKQWIILE